MNTPHRGSPGGWSFENGLQMRDMWLAKILEAAETGDAEAATRLRLAAGFKVSPQRSSELICELKGLGLVEERRDWPKKIGRKRVYYVPTREGAELGLEVRKKWNGGEGRRKEKK